MDLIGMRFEARHLEVDGKLQEALDVCHDILRHFGTEPTSDQLLPVYIQASEISAKLGDRDGAAATLLRAAERYADAGMARQVIDLYQRLRRVGPGPRGLDLQFARRMLEHRHPAAAREFLTDLARRQKKEKLLVTLERMAGWHDEKVQHMLLEFLDRAQGLRVSAAHAPPDMPTAPTAVQRSQPATPGPPRSEAVTEVRPTVEHPEPARPPAGAPPADRSPARAPSERATGPRRPVRTEPAAAEPATTASPPPPPSPPAASRPSAPRPGDVMPADKVVFVTAGAPEPDPERRRPSPRAVRSPFVPPTRRRSRLGPGRVLLGAAAVVAVAAGAAFLMPRVRRAPPPVVRQPETSLPEASGGATVPTAAASPAVDAPAGSLTVAAVPGGDGPDPVTRSPEPVTPPPPSAPPRAETAADRPPPDVQPIPVSPAVTPPRQPPPDTARPAATRPPREPVRAAPPPAVAPAPAPAAPAVEYPVVVVEDLPIVAIAREGEEGAQRIVVRQLLASGDTLDLRESDLGEASVSVGAGRLLVRRHPSGGSMGTVRVGRFLVNARAPVAPEVLEELLKRLTQRD